ncbi:zinc-binding dehydrogenase [Chelativorans sp. ZYF759]|uniref:quinone oxidoreductase family protein n=1 Tax=Chelativorans sp. ZYF759 TaxID=2692213 RepID=UPI00145D0D02|nr:zinc-binding alcohol dehydrogenase family protein [Chelativorans sp. ZYF759]NMG40670.1 zinc-binding dehydrogenase [Chelativorans sp. ZYF759]
MERAAQTLNTAPSRTADALRIAAPVKEVGELQLGPQSLPIPEPGPDEVLVEIHAAAINPSDVKAALGMMPQAVWPRTPGRDFAGVVVAGPSALVGTEVWGSSGVLGIRRDGSHATHMVMEADAVRAKPAALSMVEAGSIGVPFVTAWEGFLRSGMPAAGETVLILGINGKVGQAATQIATMLRAKVIGAVRRDEPYAGHASGPVEVVDVSSTDLAERVREMTDGRGADIVFNTVGSPYYTAGAAALGKGGRMILIATIDRAVPFDIFAFYRGRHTYFGIDTLALSTAETCDRLDGMREGFDSGALKPYEIAPTLSLSDAARAYADVLGATRDRLVFEPRGAGR